MFKATKPFEDKVSTNPEEPSLRIGRTVPKNAVNLAYYYNPTATGSEKVMTAEVSRNTIDHRVEEAYRYLFNQASADNSLFPDYVWYEDEEGYEGRLGKMYVNWYPEAHVETIHKEIVKDQIVANRENVLKAVEYPKDAEGFEGTLFLDAVDFEVNSTKTITTTEVLQREVMNHELNYRSIFGPYSAVPYENLNEWLQAPAPGVNTCWPYQIEVSKVNLFASGGNGRVVNYVNTMVNPYDEAVGILKFDHIEYEPVKTGNSDEVSTLGTDKSNAARISGKIKSQTYQFELKKPDGSPYTKESGEVCTTFEDLSKDQQSEAIEALKAYVKQCESDAFNNFPKAFNASYVTTTDNYNTSEIQRFQSMLPVPDQGLNNAMLNCINNSWDLSVVFDRQEMVIDDKNDLLSEFYWEASYYYVTSNRGAIGKTYYNVIAIYNALGSEALEKTIVTTTEVPNDYLVHANYSGVLRKVWYDYDGVAYYRGSVTKGTSVGNVNPEDDIELLMYSDADGYLRRPVYHTKDNGAVVLKNYYRVEADSVYITDVFKDGVACFYEYQLKQPIYDYRGPDSNGFYNGNAVKLCNANYKSLPTSYKHNMKLEVAETETVDIMRSDGYTDSKVVPVKYNAYLYTSFLSTSTDTHKVIYNAYNNTNDNKIENGVIEDIYNYPFKIVNQDYTLVPIDTQQRLNKILLPKPYRIRDSRYYVTFDYVVKAERKGSYSVENDGTKRAKKKHEVIVSDPITVSILNKDYALPSELDKFIDRGYIISPKIDGVYYSPMDIILAYQSSKRLPTKITASDTDYIFSCEITVNYNNHRGSINLNCNPDGSGFITAETTIDTGFLDGVDLWSLDATTFDADAFSLDQGYTYTTKLSLDMPYWIEDGWIYPALKVRCLDNRYIKTMAPREEGLLDSWYPRIQFGHYSQILDQYGTHTKVCYSMPEYDTQYFSLVYGRPYVDIKKEKVTILNPHMVKLKCFPIFVKKPSTISLFKEVDGELFNLDIQDISFSDGVIVLSDTISENDNILCDYTYLEESYVYRGFWRNDSDFARIDLNPNIYHTYNDLQYTPSEVKPSKNLFNKIIYFFMRPSIIYEVAESDDDLTYDPDRINITNDLLDNQIISTLQNSNVSLYHQIDNPMPASSHDICVGSVFIRQNSSLHSTVLIDSRSRGGGVLDSMKDSLRHELEPESDFYLDIGYYDGEPYQENGVIIVRLDNNILKEFGGRFTAADVEQKVKRWLGYGVYPIIEYVNVYSKYELPQYNMTVEDSYTNVVDEIPEIYVDYITTAVSENELSQYTPTLEISQL